MSSAIRFTGLASGMDTETLVKAMITPYQTKLDAAKQSKALLELKKDAYKAMNTKINSFYTKYIYNMSLTGTFNKTATTVSNSSIIAMDKNSAIAEGNHTIQVKHMAAGAIAATSTIAGATKDTTIAEILQKTGDPALVGNQFSMTVESGGVAKVITVGITDTMKISEFEAKVKQQLITDGVNTATSTKLNFKFDENISAFIINSTDTGADQKIAVSGESASILNASAVVNGSDAEVLYNGGVTVTSATNKIQVNGLIFDIKSVSNEVITVSSIKDTEANVSFLKEFVDEYNKLLEDLNTKLEADPAKKFRPLTDEQREAMSEGEIEKWEKKIQDGLWSNDPTLRDINSMMRQTLNQSVGTGTFKMLAEIGIKPGDWREKGKLHLDEDKLRNAISQDGAAVTDLVVSLGKSLDVKFKEKFGSTETKSYNSFFNDKSLLQGIQSKDKTILSAETKLTFMENLYYKKFTAMEKMMNQYNSQSSWLTQQSGGM